MRILGISAFHRDAAAALLIDGEPVAAGREASYTGQPGDAAFPRRAIHACLDQAGILARDLDHVVFYEKPLRKFERVLVAQLQAFPRSARSFADAMLGWLGDRLWVKNGIIRELAVDADRVLFTEQHVALAANAFYSSPFERAALLVIDDAGEWATTTLGVAGGAAAPIELLQQLDFPHSLGLLVSAITQFLGFAPGREEHLLEALAARGQPVYVDRLGELFTDQRLDQARFRFGFDAERLWDDGLCELLGAARFSGDPLLIDGDDRRHADIAASVQQLVEERVLGLAGQLRELVDCDRLCLAGALAGNRRLVTRLCVDGPFSQLHVPAVSDKAGGALGAALYVHQAVVGGGGPVGRSLPMDLGEAVEDRELPGAREFAEGQSGFSELAHRLAADRPVAWVRGRLQFTDRGDDSRCILAPPTEVARQRLLDAVRREPFTPCCLLVPIERVGDYVDPPAAAAGLLRDGLLQLPARDELRRVAAPALAADGTVWCRTIAGADDPDLHALLLEVGALTGAPLLLHHDFALRGSTVVRRVFDAVRAFERSTLDALLVGTQLLDQSSLRRAT